MEQVIAQQKAQPKLSLQRPAIFPRPTSEPCIQVAPLPPKHRRRKRSPDDTTPRPNRCPLPGTKEAKNRTLMASYARCKTVEKQRELLQKRDITEEEFRAMRRAKPSKKRARSTEQANLSSASSPEHNLSLPENEINLPSIREIFREMAWRESWLNDSNLLQDGMEINQYYSGKGRKHLFCVIARYRNLHEQFDFSGPNDYWCVSSARHACLNGNQALRMVIEILSAIQHNSGPIRYELEKQTFMYLASIISSCCATVSLEVPEIFFGRPLDEKSIFTSLELANTRF